MEHILRIDEAGSQLHQLFEKIQEGNTILFLGAGASVGEKKYLSKEIISYYEDFMGKSFNEPNITRLLDILSADPTFDRDHFDLEVEKLLRDLKTTEGHKTMASIRWREIITTNYDLLVEQAYDSVRSTHNHVFDLVPVRTRKEYNFREDNTQVKYIKLNGCISDKSKYPFAFSTEDFEKLNKFYKNTLNDLKNVSPKISLLSAGYSFQDEFGQQLLKKFDSYNYRERKWIYNIDPFPNEVALPYYSKQRICIIKCSFQEFFEHYKKWDTKGLEHVVKTNRISFTNSKNSYIKIPPKLAVSLNNVIGQLNSNVREKHIKEEEFFRGEEPNYDLILRNVDVVKRELVDEAKTRIKSHITEESDTFVPIFFLKGEFGIGKTTFTLRLIHEFISDEELDCVAFEIKDFQKMRAEFIIDLMQHAESKNAIFYCDEVEIESSFKALLALRRELSVEQFNDINVFFFVPIRDNILAKYQISRDIKKSHEITLSGSLRDEEIQELVDKLSKAGLVSFRDENERKDIIRRIKNEYGSDSFVALLDIVTRGSHINDLVGAYNQLSSDAQKAFLNTALLHRFKFGMPVSWLKHIISSSWDDFEAKVIRAEGKGILIQEHVDSTGLDPDLVFKTKHPIIAEKLIQVLIKDRDEQYKYYQQMLRSVDVGVTNSYLASNLLKTFVREETFSKAKTDKLFDAAYGQLSDDPYFCLNYAINLQYKHDIDSLKKAVDILIYAESLFDYRNHKFIHRRGVINFQLAKKYFEKEESGNLNFTVSYLNEAKDLLKLKQLLAPFSHYSYTDFISLLIWELDNIEYEPTVELKKRIQIEELFDIANRTITDEISMIHELKSRYAKHLNEVSDVTDYKQYIDDLYDDLELRPYACILLFNFYEKENGLDCTECLDYIEEMTSYMDNNEVVKFLFKYFGRRLYDPNHRMHLFKLSKSHSFLENEIPLSYYFFHFMAESYNHNFHHGRNALLNIRSKYHGLNPEFHYVWSDTTGDEELFTAKIIQRDRAKFKAVRIKSLQQTFRLKKGNYTVYRVGQDVEVKLHFYLYGIMAEIVSQ